MQIRSAQEALFLACEMERGAVRLYERTLCLLQDLHREDTALYQGVTQMHADESRHLKQFQSLYAGLSEPDERLLVLAAVADGLLFEGGLMGAVRGGLIKDEGSMLRLAAEAEEKALSTYQAFAAQCKDPETQTVLLSIAAEEARHLEELQAQLQAQAQAE